MVVFFFILSSCSPVVLTPSVDQIQTAIEQTDAAQPTLTAIPTHTSTPLPPTETPAPILTATPTRIPLSELDLAWLFENEELLPESYSRGPVSETLPPYFSQPQFVDYAVDMRLLSQGETAGGITILLYSQPAKAIEEFTWLESHWYGLPGVETILGDNYTLKVSGIFAISESDSGGGTFGTLLLCDTALVQLQLKGKMDTRGAKIYLLYYIKPNLEPLVCLAP